MVLCEAFVVLLLTTSSFFAQGVYTWNGVDKYKKVIDDLKVEALEAVRVSFCMTTLIFDSI